MKSDTPPPRIRVFAHHSESFRWRTLIQVGDDWTIRGTVWMKNPGSSRPIQDPISIFDIEALGNLDDSAGWFRFTVDPTMRAIVNLFCLRAMEKGEFFTGIIQVFNLINVMSPEVKNALMVYKSTTNALKTTADSDLKQTVPPVYIGWGDFHQHPLVAGIADRVLQSIKDMYDIEYQASNGFLHPLYLMVYGKNKILCQQTRSIFCKSGN